MLFRKIKLRQDYQSNIAAGQISFIFGVLLSRLHETPFLVEPFERLIGHGALFDIMAGFLDGFSFALIVASIFFNLRGLMLYRANR